MSQQIDELIENFDPLVEPKFKEFLYEFIQRYYHNTTREKFIHIIMNLPLGYFLNKKDIEHLFEKNRSLSYKALIDLLSKGDLKLITKEGECRSNG